MPEQDDSEDDNLDVEDVLRQHEEVEKLNYNEKRRKSLTSPPIRPSLSIENRMFNVVADLSTPKLTPSSPTSIKHPPHQKSGRRRSRFHQLPFPIPNSSYLLLLRLLIALRLVIDDIRVCSSRLRRLFLVFSFHQEKAKVKERTFGVGDDEDASWIETEAVQEKGLGLVRDGNENINLEVNRYYFRLSTPIFPLLRRRSFVLVTYAIDLPDYPNKTILFLGLLFCLFNGSLTPIFSLLFSKSLQVLRMYRRSTNSEVSF